MRLFILVSFFLLTSCSTVVKCSSIENYNDRQVCYENEKQQEYHESTGWRYQGVRRF